MATGQQTEPPAATRELVDQGISRTRGAVQAGHALSYNTSGTYMLAAVVECATGEGLVDYLRPRLFEPLGIEGPTWDKSPQGVALGGYGLSVRTEDIAKFGQLYLQRGRWQDRQLVPAAWIDEATAQQTSNGSIPTSDWDQGYGYQFWRCRHGGYRGDGAFGQYCVVLPEQDAVIAITSGLKDMQGVLNLVWDKLLPAMQSAPRAADEMASRKLREKTANLSLSRPELGSDRPAQAMKTFVFAKNPTKIESVAIERDPADGHETIVLTIDGAQQRIACGRGEWHDGQVGWFGMAKQPAAVAGGWNGDEFTAKICFYETPFIVTLRLKTTGEELSLKSENNVGFILIPATKVDLVGRAK